MEDKIKKTSEDIYADIDFDDDDSEIKNSKFVSDKTKQVKITKEKDKKLAQFYGEKDNLIAEKVIERNGKIIEIKYGILGQKESVFEYSKDKQPLKAIDYYANGVQKMVTDYGPNNSYKSMMYNADGSWLSYVEKYEDGTSEATYFDADKKGSKLIVKMDANKEVIEKRIER